MGPTGAVGADWPAAPGRERHRRRRRRAAVAGRDAAGAATPRDVQRAAQRRQPPQPARGEAAMFLDLCTTFRLN